MLLHRPYPIKYNGSFVIRYKTSNVNARTHAYFNKLKRQERQRDCLVQGKYIRPEGLDPIYKTLLCHYKPYTHE